MSSKHVDTPPRTAPEADDPDMLFREDRAADLLDVENRTLQAWRRKGTGPRYVRISARCVRYSRRELMRWIQERQRSATTEPAA
jgi:predicted DNA-binding transcriptional regulator AlpA